MTQAICQPQYMQIALDIAGRIAAGELEENSWIYGRSVMSSEYGVSPETIRRALKLLSDMKVVEVKPQSGVFILSAEHARQYIERFAQNNSMRSMHQQFRELIAQQQELGRQLCELSGAMLKMQETHRPQATPFTNYEATVAPDSSLIGRNVGELRFWQATGATIVAIRRGGHIILSPGPYAQLAAGDVIIFVGGPLAVEAVNRFLGNSLPQTDLPQAPVAARRSRRG